jgi:hypothetical protein
MALVKEYIDRYREDRQEQDLIKILEFGLIKAVGEYARRNGWDKPEEWISNILNDEHLGKETQEFWVQALLQHGYYKRPLVREALDFERGLDPKKVLNLGILEQILIYAQYKCQEEKDWSWSSPSGWQWEIQEDKNLPLETKVTWIKYLQEHPEYLKISMDENGNISEALGFERGLTPKQSMGIGLEEQIRNFLDERTSSSPSLWISYLLSEGTDEELDRETRKKWIEFLLTKPMYVTDLGEEEYYNLKEWGIEWIPYVPLANKDFKYKKLGTKYILDFHGWEDFSPCFDYDRELSEEFVQAVLSGDAFDQFEYDLSGFKDITDLSWALNRELKKRKKIPALEDIKRIAIALGGNPENMEDLDQLFDEISTNEDLSELDEAISFAFEESQQSADEHEAYTKLKEAIQKHFGIEEGKWIGEGEKAYYRAPISFEGLHKLAFCLATNEEQIKYSHPYGGYSGDISAETFNDAMYNKLEDF